MTNTKNNLWRGVGWVETERNTFHPRALKNLFGRSPLNIRAKHFSLITTKSIVNSIQ